MITWSAFLRLFSDEPSGSSVSEMFEFLKSQNRETLPQELQDVLGWHESKLKSDVSFVFASLLKLTKENNGFLF